MFFGVRYLYTVKFIGCLSIESTLGNPKYTDIHVCPKYFQNTILSCRVDAANPTCGCTDFWNGWIMSWEFYFYKLHSPTPLIHTFTILSGMYPWTACRKGQYFHLNTELALKYLHI